MKIAFWSEVGQSGTTSNMLACAAMLSILYPNAEIVVQSLGAWKGHIQAKQKVPEEGDFYFLDCGAGTDNGKLSILKQMDMVVVNLKQEKESLDRFFLEDIHSLSDFLVLVGNYYGGSAFNRAYLERVYRIVPEWMGVISNNGEFYHACELAKVRRFVKKEYAGTKSVRNEQLLEELEQFTKQIITKMEDKIQGGI